MLRSYWRWFRCFHQLIYRSSNHCALKMKLFQTAQKLCQMLDIWPSQSNRSCTFSRKNVLFFVCRIPIIVSSLGYIIFEKATIIQRTRTFFAFITHVFATANFVITFSEMSKIVGFIERIEQLIQQSKCRIEVSVWSLSRVSRVKSLPRRYIGLERTSFETVISYSALNEKIEKVSKLLYHSLLKFTPAAVLTPSLIVTSINYFVNDLEEDSFELPFSTLYVREKCTLPIINIENSIFPSIAYHSIGETGATIWLFSRSSMRHCVVRFCAWFPVCVLYVVPLG